ncbi:MAG: right-handed parallel beta-helix repeat-containing protein [Planctomycetia bacterium]
MPSLGAEALEPRLALAVVPVLDAATLRITLDAADDHALLSRVGEQYVVYGPSEVGSFPVQRVARVVVNGSPAMGQSFTIASGGGLPITAALSVDATVESTKLRAPIVTSGDVVVESPAITLAGEVKTKGLQRYVGAVIVDPPARGVLPLPRDLFDWAMGDDPIMVSQTGNVLLAKSTFGQSVTIVDTRKAAWVANVPLPLLPMGIAVTADGSRGFVSHDLVEDVGGTARPQVAVSTIDVANHRVSQTVGVGVQGNVAGMAVSPEGKRLYVVCESIDQRPSSLVVIDADRMTVETTIALPLSPYRVQSILVSGDGKRVYVVDAGANLGGFSQTFIDPSITVVDATTNTIAGTIALGVFGPGALADCRLGSDGKTAFAISVYGMVGVIDLARMTVTKTFTPVSGGQNVRLAPSSDGRWLHVIAPDGLASRLVDVRVADGKVVKSRSVPAAGNIVLAPGTNRTFLRIDSGIAVVEGSSPGTGVLTLQGASVAFNSTVDGSAGLEVLSPGVTTFAAAVGASSPLASLVTDRGGSVSLHSVATSGIQRYADAAVQLSGDFSITKPVVSGEAFAVLGRTTLVSDCTVTAVGGRVAFQGTVDGVARLTVDGRATAPGGVTDVVFRQRVGGGVPLVSMSFVGLAGVVADRAVSVNGRGFWDGPVGIRIDTVKRVRLTAPGSEIQGSDGWGMFIRGDGADVIISGFRITGNFGGVVLNAGDLSRTRIVGNTIEGNIPGIRVEGRGALIQGNTIRNNGSAGIELRGPNASSTMLSNTITGNGPPWTVLPERGIVAAEEAVTPPAPTVQSIERVKGMVRVTLKSNLPAFTTLRFQLFANRAPPAAGDADVAGLVQGERLIADVLRGASNGTTTISLPARSLPAGDWVTVTATTTRPGEAGSTSCFSKAVRVP